MAIKLHASRAVHPGAWLRSKTIDPHGLFATDAAAKLHVTRQAMNNLLGARACRRKWRSASKRRSG